MKEKTSLSKELVQIVEMKGYCSDGGETIQ